MGKLLALLLAALIALASWVYGKLSPEPVDPALPKPAGSASLE